MDIQRCLNNMMIMQIVHSNGTGTRFLAIINNIKKKACGSLFFFSKRKADADAGCKALSYISVSTFSKPFSHYICTPSRRDIIMLIIIVLFYNLLMFVFFFIFFLCTFREIFPVQGKFYIPLLHPKIHGIGCIFVRMSVPKSLADHYKMQTMILKYRLFRGKQ